MNNSIIQPSSRSFDQPHNKVGYERFIDSAANTLTTLAVDFTMILHFNTNGLGKLHVSDSTTVFSTSTVNYESPPTIELPRLTNFEIIDHRDPPLDTRPMMRLLDRLEARELRTLVLSLKAVRRDRAAAWPHRETNASPHVYLAELRAMDEGLNVLINVKYHFPFLARVQLNALCKAEKVEWPFHKLKLSMPRLRESGLLQVGYDRCNRYVAQFLSLRELVMDVLHDAAFMEPCGDQGGYLTPITHN